MTIFDELRLAYTTWNERYSRYQIESAQFAQRFAEGFREYTGVPSAYLDIDRSRKWYVELLKAVPQDDGRFLFEQPKFPTDALDRDANGYWITGLRITVDREPNTYPKMYFAVLLKFILKENTCEMEVGFEPKHFSFSVTGSNEAKPVYDYIIGLMHSIFEMQPWQVNNRKSPIGFVPPQTS